eukprot:6928104-Prymnesium_polylepis.1
MWPRAGSDGRLQPIAAKEARLQLLAVVFEAQRRERRFGLRVRGSAAAAARPRAIASAGCWILRERLRRETTRSIGVRVWRGPRPLKGKGEVLRHPPEVVHHPRLERRPLPQPTEWRRFAWVRFPRAHTLKTRRDVVARLLPRARARGGEESGKCGGDVCSLLGDALLAKERVVVLLPEGEALHHSVHRRLSDARARNALVFIAAEERHHL